MFRPVFLRRLSSRPLPATLLTGAFVVAFNHIMRGQELTRRLDELRGKRVRICAAELPWALEVRVDEGGLRIAQEGRSRKFIGAVEEITFNGKLAAAAGQRVLYVTERCVLELTGSGLELVEVAPGIDLEREILDLMDFRPIVREPKSMDLRLFQTDRIGLEELLLGRPLADRFTLDQGRSMLFIDYAGFRVQRQEQVEAVREQVRALVGPLGRKVEAVIVYDGCSIDPTLAEAWFDMAQDVQSRFYAKASRYTTSAFMRLKLGDALQRRQMAPHVFETAAEAAGAGPSVG